MFDIYRQRLLIVECVKRNFGADWRYSDAVKHTRPSCSDPSIDSRISLKPLIGRSGNTIMRDTSSVEGVPAAAERNKKWGRGAEYKIGHSIFISSPHNILISPFPLPPTSPLPATVPFSIWRPLRIDEAVKRVRLIFLGALLLMKTLPTIDK